MSHAVDSIASVLEQLNERLRELESRIALLESHPAILGRADAAPTQTSTLAPPFPRPLREHGGFDSLSDQTGVSTERSRRDPYPQSTAEPESRPAWGLLPAFDIQNGVIPSLGKAVLGIAGAYLLRAIAESGSIPKLPVLIIAILYAAFWMLWSTRAASRFARVTYAVNSAVILSPLLWESTVRFQVLPPAFTAAVLAAYVIFAIALAWRRNLQFVPWVATTASVLTALALIIATHELVALTTALLAISLAIEAAVCLGRKLTVRALPALAADFAIWLVVSILASETIPEGYRAATPSTISLLCFLLLMIYGASVGVRSFALLQKLTVFEIAQSALAFALGSFGAMRATENHVTGALGGFFLFLAIICYWGALSKFLDLPQTRNRRVSAAWAAALTVAGSFLLLPLKLEIAFLCLASVAAAFVYTRTRKTSLGLHASFYLALAAGVSPLALYASSAFAGKVPGAPDSRALMVAIAAALCYGIGSRVAETISKRRLLWALPGAIAGFTAAALIIAAIVHAPRLELAASTLSVVRTIVNCALALAFGFFGSRSRRIELRWLAYAAVAFGTLKLLFEDLRFGNAASLVVSLLFYGLVLILLPRLTRHAEQ
jgi:hypothetical protein